MRETGANRVDKAQIVALRGIVGRSAEKVSAARDALSDVAEGGRNSVFPYVTSGDGFYRDGSFVQHGNLAYVGTYGNAALGGVANLITLLGGSTWQINGTATAPHPACSSSPAESRSPTPRGTGRSPRGWITRDRVSDYLTGASIPEISRAKAVLDDPAVAATPELPAHFQDRVVHRRDGWTFAIAMSSKRMARYEWGNGENLRGCYVGDGMTYLYKDDHAQFYDAFWPTVDAQRLPGTTVSTRLRQPHGTGGGTGTIAAYAGWVGGAPYRKTAGAVGMHLINQVKSLQARKSWFCLSDSVVALGAGISGRLPGRDGGREPEPARGPGSGPAGRRSQSTGEPGLDRLVRRAKLGAPRGSGRVPVPPATPISSASSSTGPWA